MVPLRDCTGEEDRVKGGKGVVQRGGMTCLFYYLSGAAISCTEMKCNKGIRDT